MQRVKEAFVSVIAHGEGAVITSPGAAGLYVLLEGMYVEIIENIYLVETWPDRKGTKRVLR